MAKRVVINPIRIFLYIIIILNINVFYLVDTSVTPISDICIIVELIFTIYVYYRYRSKIKYRYGWLMLIPILFAVISAYMANQNYMGQSFMLGFRPQRAWMAAMLMYFPMVRLLKTGALDKEEIMHIIDNVMIIYSVIIMIQFMVGFGYQFMYVLATERYGSIRLYVSMTCIFVSYFYHLSKILNREKIQFKDVFMVVIAIFIVLFIEKSRMRIVSLLGSSIIYLFSQKLSTRKLAIMVICIAGCCVFLSSDVGADIMDMASGSGQSTEDTSEIRDEGREFYIESNTQSWQRFVFGSGYPNEEWPPAVILSGSDMFFANDNGMFGLFFYYGFIFVIWATVLSFKNIRYGIKGGTPFLAFYAIYGLLGCYTLYPCFYVTDISFAVLCAVTEVGFENTLTNNIRKHVYGEIQKS